MLGFMYLAQLPLGASVASCAVAILLSLPHSYHVLVLHFVQDKFHNLNESDSLSDELITYDKSPRSVWQRVTLALAGVVGFSASLLSCVTTDTSTIHILESATWALILFQTIVLATLRDPIVRYSLGCYSAITALATSVGTFLHFALNLDRTLTSNDALTVVQLVAALFLIVVNLAIPRGPNVYRSGRVVDAHDSVSFLNRYTFSWAYKTLSHARKNGKLEPIDLPLVPQNVRAQVLSDRFFASGSTSVQWRKWLKLYWKSVAVQITIQLCSGAVRFLPNLLLLTILRLFEDRDAGVSNQLRLWLTALFLGLSILTSSWLISLRDFVVDLKISLPVNEQLLAVIITRAMGLKDIVSTPCSDDESDGKDSDGQNNEDSDKVPQTKHSILNLLGVDVAKISDFIAYSHLLLDSAIELTLTVVFLWFLMGWKSSIAGCAIPFLLSPVYYRMMKLYSEKEHALMERRDEKSASLTEMVRGIRQIKFSALESQWYRKIQNLRAKEVQQQWAVFQLNIYLTAIWTFGPVCMSFVSISNYVYLNGAISPSIAFTALSLFETLQYILSILPEVLTDLLDAGVSLRRIARFLGLESHIDDRVSGDSIKFINATITWPSKASEDSDPQFKLGNLNLSFPSEGLSIISGKSGAGKSLLLQAIIGEADVVNGTVIVPRSARSSDSPASFHDWLLEGSLAYVSQDPWIENATIRDSILFGLPWNSTRYHDVIEACALSADLEIFPDGDKTDVGTNGINLSGGQKWRLALARALYSRASTLVLDDIFSAVDSHVGRHLYENALTGPLAQGRTRVLATHHVKLCVEGGSYFVKLDKGNVVEARNIDSAGIEYSGTMDNSETSNSRPMTPITNAIPGRRESMSSAKNFYEDERRETGVVHAKVYRAYILASGGYLLWVVIVLILAILLLLNLAIPYWVAIWTRSYEKAGDILVAQSHENPSGVEPAQRPQIDKRLLYYGSIYLAISASSWIFDMIRFTLILNGSIKASKEMFETFTAGVLHAPLRFLDTTPVGQILNRFTSDFGILDSDLATDLSYTMHGVITLVGILVAALVTSPFIVGLGIVALSASWIIGSLYVTGAREAKRLESTAKSPIFDLIGSLLSGLPTVRAFGREKAYLERMYKLIDTHCQAVWHRRLFYCWMGFWLSLVGAVFVASVTMIFVSVRTFDAPLAGFALSFALDMANAISWLLAQYADLEINLNAAERIVEYTQLETEPSSGVDVPAAWPVRGEISVTGLTVAYAPDLPPVLRNLDFCIQSGERIGVVGRTGAGKSSFAMTLLRCLDLRSGTIHVDGIDISKIKLHDLRSRIGMISQDPIVFTGTVRQVLDPFNQHDDTELCAALQKVSLSSPHPTTVGNHPTLADSIQLTSSLIPLSFTIAEGGKNLSQGQRQLLCLARALVSAPKILVMDEATASIDMESDIHIQRALREEIRGCTLIVIAHRLSTIADFDRIIVLEKGEVVEMDTPRKLMGIRGGYFRGLVEGSGERGAIEEMIFEDSASN